jgi:hypothetical protein
MAKDREICTALRREAVDVQEMAKMMLTLPGCKRSTRCKGQAKAASDVAGYIKRATQGNRCYPGHWRKLLGDLKDASTALGKAIASEEE